MKKIILIGLITLLFFGFTPYKELNDLAVVDTLGISYKNNKYYLHLNVVNKDNKVYEVSGDSLGEVFFKARNIDNKKTYYNHLGVVVFDTNILTKDYQKVLSFLKEEFTGIDYLVLASKIDIDTLFKDYHKQKDYKNFILKEKEETGKIIDITFKELLSSSLDKIDTSFLPIINISKKLISDGILVADKNLILDETLAKATYILNEEVSEYSKNININNTSYQVYVYDIKTNISYKENKLKIKITGKIDSPDTNDLEQIQEYVEKSIKDNINNLIKEEINNKFNISSLINYINLKTNDKDLYEIYNTSKKEISISLKKERKNNYD